MKFGLSIAVIALVNNVSAIALRDDDVNDLWSDDS